jgi:hypothetical protein
LRKLTFKCAITSGLTPFINLQNQSVSLRQNGNVWTGSLAVDLDSLLNIAVTVSGINYSPWSVDITIDCPGGTPAKIFSRSGKIPHGGSEAFTTSTKVPDQPCPSSAAMVMADSKVKAKTKKPKTKKTGKSKKKTRRT